MSAIVVHTATPDDATAGRIAAALVEARLAACVHRLPVRSCYRWQDAVEHADEVRLEIKTLAAAFDPVAARIRTLHPYDVPEIVALPLTHATPDYLAWIAASVSLE